MVCFICLSLFVHMAPLLQISLRVRRHRSGGVTTSLFRDVNVNVKSEVANDGQCDFVIREGDASEPEPQVFNRRAIRDRLDGLG